MIFDPWKESAMVMSGQLLLILQVLIFAATALHLCATAEGSSCLTNGFPIVRNISELPQSGYVIPGLSHSTIIGSVLHGMKEIEIWIQTLAPGCHTPIHRHACEEVFVILKGNATLYLSPNNPEQSKFPGNPQALPIYTNSTFHVPVDDVHQIWNTNEDQDLQFIVVISRPPAVLYTYDDWFVPHTEAKLLFPIYWDEECYRAPSQKDEL